MQLLSIAQDAISNCVCIHICSLIPRAKTMVIALRMGIVHMQNCALTMYLEPQLTQSLPAVVGNAYGYHVDKVLSSVTTIKKYITLGDARMASFYD